MICTFAALSSGLFGSYFGGQMSWLVHTSSCQNQPQGLNVFCQAWVSPGAVWKGSTAGLWTGTIVGAFVGGLATREEER